MASLVTVVTRSAAAATPPSVIQLLGPAVAPVASQERPVTVLAPMAFTEMAAFLSACALLWE